MPKITIIQKRSRRRGRNHQNSVNHQNVPGRSNENRAEGQPKTKKLLFAYLSGTSCTNTQDNVAENPEPTQLDQKLSIYYQYILIDFLPKHD